MGVVKAKFQTVEDMYRLIWTAVANKQPISAIYKDLPRLFCPHRLGRNRLGEPRVLCYQYGGESESGLGPIGSPENWRCVVFKRLRRVELLTIPGRPRPITRVQQLAWWRRILTPRISRRANRRMGTERARRSGAEPGSFSR